MKKHLKHITSVGSFVALASLIAGATFILVLVGKGYVFNFRTGEVSGGGLVLLKSEPGEAEIFIDNKTKGKAPKRIPLKAGRYQLKLVKAGYRDWHKAISVEPSAVSWQQYPFLIPDSLSTNTVAPLDNPSVFAQSVNTKFFAIAQNGAVPKVDVFEVNKTKPKTVFTLTPEQVAQNMRIVSVSWSRDDDHILIRSEGSAGVNYFITSISNTTDLHDITKEFSLPLDNVSFSYSNWRELYWLDSQGLRLIDIANKTVSAVLAERVTSYSVTPEAVFFVQRNETTNRVMRLNGDQPPKALIEKLPPNDLKLGFVDYGDKQNLILHDKTRRRVSLYPSTTQSNAKLSEYKNIDVINFLVSKDNRYLLLQGELNFATIDFEFSKLYRFSLGTNPVTNLTWFDRYHLLGTIGTSTVLFEFDGGNPETLINSVPSFPSFSADSQNYLYTIGSSPGSGQPVLQTTKLKR